MRNGADTDASIVHITPIEGRAALLLKTWSVEHASGATPVVIGGRELPARVGTTSSAVAKVLCLAPAEWLIVSSERTAADLRARFEPDLATQGLVLADLSDGLAVIDVRGSAAREVLSKGCGLDFHPRSFATEHCARTRFAQISVVLDCLDAPPRFELYVGRSYLHYLRRWLADAAVEFAGE